MRAKFILSIMLLLTGLLSCDDDDNKVADPIYEFVAFDGNPSIQLNEFSASEEPFPLVAKLLAFDPYAQDIELSLEITGTNVEENIDFTVTPSNSVKIRAGQLVSDTVWIQTIDNPTATDLDRSFQIEIKSISQTDVKIGLGLSDPKNAAVSFSIVDDECSLTTSVYNTTLNNEINEGAVKSAEGVLTGDMLKVTGDLIDYGPFAGATISIALTPDSPGATKGKAIFGEQEAGADSDGYEYKFTQVGDGSYDVCSGTVIVEYDIYYMDGGWAYWYSVTNVFSVP